LALAPYESADPEQAEVEQLIHGLAGEGISFRSPLNLNKPTAPRAHNIHVNLRPDIFSVVKVEHGPCINEPGADGSHQVSEGRRFDPAELD
jgi:hypothetical protein